MSLFHSMCKEYKVIIIWIMFDPCMNYMKPSDKSIDNTQVYNCGQLVAPLWWLNWPPRTISSGYLGRPQRWPLLPLSSTNISTTQEVSQIGKWAAGCRRRHLHLPTFAPLQLLFCLTRRPAPAAFLLLITVSSVFPLSPAACLAPTPCQTSPLLIEILFASLTGWHSVSTTYLLLKLNTLFYKHYLQARPR